MRDIASNFNITVGIGGSCNWNLLFSALTTKYICQYYTIIKGLNLLGCKRRLLLYLFSQKKKEHRAGVTYFVCFFLKKLKKTFLNMSPWYCCMVIDVRDILFTKCSKLSTFLTMLSVSQCVIQYQSMFEKMTLGLKHRWECSK